MSDLREPIGQSFETTFAARETGLVGTVAYRIDDNEGSTIVGPTTAGITELGTTGIYAASPTAPGTEGTWTIIWTKDGTFDPTTLGVDTLVTYDPGVAGPTIPDLPPTSDDGISSVGPCQAWSTADEVAAFCGSGSDADEYEDATVAASQVLYALSAHRFPGTCSRSVRPCGTSRCAPWDLRVLWGGTDWIDPYDRSRGCGCTPLSVVPLAGYAREIIEVLIDGQAVDPDTYRLDERRRLVRLDDPDSGERLYWPSCQNLAVDSSEEGTFEVTYTYGVDPPAIGQMAARELACAIYDAGADAALSEECVLPNGVTKIVRQGLTIELVGEAGFGFVDGVWKTGLPLVDMFLNAYNPTGRRKRRTMVWSPDLDRFPRAVGDPLAS